MGSEFEYHNAPDKTAAAHRAGGLGTLGDIGYFDDDGYLYLSDRKIDMIVSGGVNIYPAEIEGVLVEHPAIADAAVFGIPNDEMGESVHAAVALRPGHTWSDPLHRGGRRALSRTTGGVQGAPELRDPPRAPSQRGGQAHQEGPPRPVVGRP